ncbi:MAG: TIGR00730 family Rossman fold protein [Bdellovibrionia bacterium]
MRICVYCGAKNGSHQVYQETAKELGKMLAQSNIELVYGGGHVGLMGTIADSVIQNGGKVIGVIPQKLVDKEQAHHSIQDLRIVEDMHQRKAMMANLSDAFIALPGGFGTLEELFEVLTWSQIGYHQKPIALINVNCFYDSLVKFIDHAIQEGFIFREHRELLKVVSTPQMALDSLLQDLK